KKAPLFVFLRQVRHTLFGDAFQAQLAATYKPSPKGRPPTAPGLLAMADALQAATGVSDAEAARLAGDPMTDRRGIRHRLRRLERALARTGHLLGRTTIRRVLRAHDIRPKGASIPDRRGEARSWRTARARRRLRTFACDAGARRSPKAPAEADRV